MSQSPYKKLPHLHKWELLFIILFIAPASTTEVINTFPPTDQLIGLWVSLFTFSVATQLFAYWLITRISWILITEEGNLAFFLLMVPVAALTMASLYVANHYFVAAPTELFWVIKPTFTFGLLAAEMWFVIEILILMAFGAYYWLRDLRLYP